MKQYGSQNEWRRIGTGWYVSPCGEYAARKDDERWVLTRHRSFDPPAELGRFLTLADCQSRAARPRVGLPLQVERERVFRLALKYAGFTDGSVEIAVSRNRHVIEEEGIRP